MIYSPFYRPRYPFSYSKPVNNIYTYSVKKNTKSSDKKKDSILDNKNYNKENKKATTNNENQIEIFRNFFIF